jgi:hypothetical protein
MLVRAGLAYWHSIDVRLLGDGSWDDLLALITRAEIMVAICSKQVPCYECEGAGFRTYTDAVGGPNVRHPCQRCDASGQLMVDARTEG